MMRWSLAVVCAALLMASCATTKEFSLTDGRKGYSISCDGADIGINACFEKAAESCKSQDYDVISKSGQIVPVNTANTLVQPDSSPATINEIVSYGYFNTKSIMIACR
jgi:hypothetical protein